jgi:hypothetical protein
MKRLGSAWRPEQRTYGRQILDRDIKGVSSASGVDYRNSCDRLCSIFVYVVAIEALTHISAHAMARQ